MPDVRRRSFARRLFSWRRVIAYSALYLLALTIGCAMSLTDRLVMIPSTQPIRLNDVERITLPPDGDRVIELYRNRNASTRPSAFVLAFTGNASRAEQDASLTMDEWIDLGADVYAMNYPGYGRSTGPARLKSAAAAGLAAYDWLRERAGDRPIYLVGNSLGTTVALHVAAERPGVAGLMLTNPPALRQLILGRFGWWNLWLAAGPIALGVPGELDSVANAARCRQPAVFVTSGRDEVVPIEYQRRVVDAYAGPRRSIDRADARHNDPMDPTLDRAMRDHLDWLTSPRN
jgi:pimeloyl-ACP methyl ester carboxylesterase